MERGRGPQLDTRAGVTCEQVSDLDALDRLDGRGGDVEAVVQDDVERLPWHPVGIERRLADALQPAALDDRDTPRRIAVEPALDVVLRRRADRPEARPRAVAREPVQPAVAVVDRPDLAVA